ncbi:hypothetical protein IMG5_047760 [Ichthyophthirius multifiliis]|uniref:Transmembrane protein n=1 Tax=Ichthyophthirius multifiliis TaxID=5932 RepID=G0QMD6_ICHMU|nr:hypothetical protein IMG5_047760 [Ichthyophthirius multifiliis]EGR33630.1 hypothetical protein IMG5_047760 [Ichthyophthirius multifiliis]|eukprot:XP_004037616.1 hypothetical protein IMG5_047760 [Ichthyophthirius multifiliis]
MKTKNQSMNKYFNSFKIQQRIKIKYFYIKYMAFLIFFLNHADIKFQDLHQFHLPILDIFWIKNYKNYKKIHMKIKKKEKNYTQFLTYQLFLILQELQLHTEWEEDMQNQQIIYQIVSNLNLIFMDLFVKISLILQNQMKFQEQKRNYQTLLFNLKQNQKNAIENTFQHQVLDIGLTKKFLNILQNKFNQQLPQCHIKIKIYTFFNIYDYQYSIQNAYNKFRVKKKKITKQRIKIILIE